MKRILITGSREWSDRDLILEALITHANDDVNEHPENTVLIHGANPRGADTIGAQEAEKLGYTIEAYPADWRRGKVAGHLRNQQMVDTGADVCLAFPTLSSRGTWDCVRRAKAAGIPVVIVREKPEVEQGKTEARAEKANSSIPKMYKGHVINDNNNTRDLGADLDKKNVPVEPFEDDCSSPETDLFTQFGFDTER